MFGSVALEVAIGLVFVFLLLSLVCSAVREAIEARLKSRAIHLELGIRELLRQSDDGQAAASGAASADGRAPSEGLTEAMFRHPMIFSLFQGEYRRPAKQSDLGGLRWLWATLMTWKSGSPTQLPSYIPARNFAMALLDIAGRGPARTEVDPGSSIEPLSVDLIRQNAATYIHNPLVRRVVLSALDNARGDIDIAILNVQAWYDSAMDRVSGWYKRETQHIVFWLGLILAIVLNVDTIALVRHLATSEAARNALVTQATGAAGDPSLRGTTSPLASKTSSASSSPAGAAASGGGTTEGAGAAASNPDDRVRELRGRLDALGLPIGWGEVRPASPRRDGCVAASPTSGYFCDVWPYGFSLLLASILGWLLTAFAISFGAPFWFDLLNKLMVIRSTVKPHEKSREEASEDRQSPSGGTAQELALQLAALQPMMRSLTSASLSAPAAAPITTAHGEPEDDLLKLGLSAVALRAARELRRAHPRVSFTSGRRTKERQARAMASNVIKNRQWIEQTYKDSRLRRLCQQWVDSHPQARTIEQIQAGLIEVFDSVSEAELGQFSKHLSGDAFDVQPVTENAEAIKQTIRALPGLVLFLDHEGGLERWHAEFGRAEE